MFKFFKKFYPAVIVLVIFISYGAKASLITIDFEDFPLGEFSSGVEDGVVINAFGSTPEVSIHVGDDNSAMSQGCCGAMYGTHSLWEFSLLNTDMLFMFEQFDIAGTNLGGDHIVVAGYLNDVIIGTDVYTTESIFYKTEKANQLNGLLVDEIKITMRNVVNFPHMDNIILKTQVPEPLTLAIFSLGMIGLVSQRFKKQS
jgi:hypothetical protein